MNDRFILTINAGSSSLKFALFREDGEPAREMVGKFERIGLRGGKVTVTDVVANKRKERPCHVPNHLACVPLLADLLQRKGDMGTSRAIGHRIVHGGPRYCEPQPVDAALLTELRRMRSFDPDHLPAALGLVKDFRRRYPHAPQVACFDTAFHRHMPRVAKLLPIPRRYEARGVQRYGFHGLSYAYLMRELEQAAGATAARGRVILAHLGNGASMAAVRDGQSIDTTMAFTPAAGLVMSARSGDLDPGLVAYFVRNEGMTARQFNDMVNTQSGLLGVSETSPDVRDLLAREERDPRAAEALALFCYQAKKWIGALSAALGGLDTLVFSGGIGENSVPLRARICQGLDYLGVELNPTRNQANAPVISREGRPVTVRVIRTDEEWHVARIVCELLADSAPRGSRQRKEARL